MHNSQSIMHNLILPIPYFRQIMRLVETWRAISDVIFNRMNKND